MTNPIISTDIVPGLGVPVVFDIKNKEFASVHYANAKGTQSLTGTQFLITPEQEFSMGDEHLFNTIVTTTDAPTTYYLQVPKGTFNITQEQIGSLIIKPIANANGILIANPDSNPSGVSDINSVIIAEKNSAGSIYIKTIGDATNTVNSYITTNVGVESALINDNYLIKSASELNTLKSLGKFKAAVPVKTSDYPTEVSDALDTNPVMISIKKQAVDSGATQDIFVLDVYDLETPTNGTKIVEHTPFNGGSLNTNAILLKGGVELDLKFKDGGAPQLAFNQLSEVRKFLVGDAFPTLTSYDVNGHLIKTYTADKQLSLDGSDLATYVSSISAIPFANDSDIVTITAYLI